MSECFPWWLLELLNRFAVGSVTKAWNHLLTLHRQLNLGLCLEFGTEQSRESLLKKGRFLLLAHVCITTAESLATLRINLPVFDVIELQAHLQLGFSIRLSFLQSIQAT